MAILLILNVVNKVYYTSENENYRNLEIVGFGNNSTNIINLLKKD